MTSADLRKDHFFALVERYCELGRSPPSVEDIDVDDLAELASIKTILAEMAETKARMDALLVSTT